MIRQLLIAMTVLVAGLTLAPTAAADCFDPLDEDPLDEECDGGFPIDRAIGAARFVRDCAKEVGLDPLGAECQP